MKTKKQKALDVITHANVHKQFETEQAAREYARQHCPNHTVTIIESVHADNKNGNFFLESPVKGFIRTWETELHYGLGKNA